MLLWVVIIRRVEEKKKYIRMDYYNLKLFSECRDHRILSGMGQESQIKKITCKDAVREFTDNCQPTGIEVNIYV